jgi:hypothetical protein
MYVNVFFVILLNIVLIYPILNLFYHNFLVQSHEIIIFIHYHHMIESTIIIIIIIIIYPFLFLKLFLEIFME